MQQIDLAYLTGVGGRIRAIIQLANQAEGASQWGPLFTCQQAIHELIYSSVYAPHFKPSLLHSAGKFVAELKTHIDKIWPPGGGASHNLSPLEISDLMGKFSRFEAVLEAELQSIGGYIVTQKSGFDTAAMVENGQVFFNKELESKVPEAIPDVRQAMRCIAFELPTAAGFHLHRANESVLRKFWDSVTNGKERPSNGNMGVYLSALRDAGAGKKSTLSQLQSLKDFHRNPLMHPEQSLETVDAAIDLMAAIRCSVGYMLDEI
ncbi:MULTISPECIES: hypothetical protein [unclassified Erythrobacter]|nr:MULTISPECIES: hypothetical protein [unclassified Erythrobacter]